MPRKKDKKNKDDWPEDDDKPAAPLPKSDPPKKSALKNNKADVKEVSFTEQEESDQEEVQKNPFDALNEEVSELSVKPKKKKGCKAKKDATEEEVVDEPQQEEVLMQDADEPTKGHFQSNTDNLTATGILMSPERSKDVQIDKFSVAAYGTQLVNDTSLNLIYGKKYGLVGVNASGKSTLLKCLAHREVPIQSGVELYLLEKEYDPTDLTAVEAVVDIVKTERDKLDDEMEELLGTIEGAESARMDFIHERLQELDLSIAASKAKTVLHGLGFTDEMQGMKTKEFSGGWRMRVALARALFVQPTVLLLDDATNHLDLSAVVWLEDYLKSYPHTIVMVSHSSDFMNGICTDIMYLQNKKLSYYGGNYDTFLRVKSDIDEATLKKAKADNKKMQKIKENMSKQGAAGKQAKSHQKMVMKQQEKDGGALDLNDFKADRPVTIRFQPCGGGLPSPFLKFNDVSFAYPCRKELFHNLNFGIDLKSRVALVGPNGIGKSTMMKLMAGELEPTHGEVQRHHHLKIARFHQHLTEQLNLEDSAVEWMCKHFDMKPQQMRSLLGGFGLTGKSQTSQMSTLSDGQLRRVVFAWLSLMNSHLLMLDEPTNFLDLDTIDALAEGIRNFDGAVVLISHDFRLINQVADQIWVVEDGTIIEWEDDIAEYKNYLRKLVAQQEQ